MVAIEKQRLSSEPERNDMFLARMRAQCEQIEAYRLNVLRREGRKLTLDQAAREWIERYAQDFTAN
ncbi:hypothetical protein [Haliea sp. E17]|uniref:hypothetical protein n=1 Tax=Haliea sp. E17 TaxID=3401576 RepID=UPI003AAC532C